MDLVEAQARGFAAGGRHPWERARLALVSDLVARHGQLGPGDLVLDVGCGDTFVIDALGQQYPRVAFHAVDPAFTDGMIQLYRTRLTAKNVALESSLDAVEASRPAALILLMDVIEHVPDDRAFLGDLCRRGLVGPETKFLITVPSYPSLFCSHDRFLGHYRRYSRKSLRALFDAVNLATLEEGHFFMSLLPPRLLQVVGERLTRGTVDEPTGLATWRGGEASARALAAILTADGRLSFWLSRLGLKVPGLSNFAICRKSA